MGEKERERERKREKKRGGVESAEMDSNKRKERKEGNACNLT